MPAGRPSDYTPQLAIAICARLADGESLRSVCRDEAMPDKASVFRWLREHADFCDQYARAKEESADTHADEILDIADEGSNDWMQRNDPENPGWVANGEAIQRSRLRVDTRKWIASKLKPKKYGEKVSTEISGPDGGAIKIYATPADEMV
jgi:hypothetical protein